MRSDGPATGRGAYATLALFSVRTALEAVAHNRLRAALTSLGILFGVASVIAMLAIGKGAESEILAQMQLLGSNNIMVAPIVEQREEEVGSQQAATPRKYTPGLTALDAAAIAATVPLVQATSAEVVLHTTFTREGRRRSGKLVGVDSAYFGLLNIGLASGRWFTPAQITEGRPVAIIGHGVRARFFTTVDPIGQQLKVGEIWVTVVGVLADRQVAGDAAERLGIRDANMDVYVPLPTMLRRFRNRALLTRRDVEAASRPTGVVVATTGDEEEPEARAERTNYHQLDRIVVRVGDADAIPGVADLVQRLLARRHNGVVDFEVTVPQLLLQQEQRTKALFNAVLFAIASISLLVGGIGIMNIMLASILERTREIGVRRAMGATQREILAQFLAEAVLISVAGGLAGILLGAGGSAVVERVAGVATIVSAASVAVAFGVSISVGVVFGIVPAWRAAQQDPVVCLRYE